jgi:hypothetical protein
MSNWIGKLVGGGFEGIANGIDEIVTSFTGDKAEQQKMAAKLKELVYRQKHETEQAAAKIVETEAQSEHWLTANWRPLTMLVFVVIIANNYIIAPYTEAMFGITVMLEIPPDMWDLLKLGLGGYVAGRSAEKGIKAWKDKG